MSGFQDAIAALYAEAERLRDIGQKKKAAAFAEAACLLELRQRQLCRKCGAGGPWLQILATGHPVCGSCGQWYEPPAQEDTKT